MIPIRIGTRGSALAIAQTNLVVAAFERSGQSCVVVIIETEGDRRAPDTAWGEGAFVAAIEQALLDGRVDLAIHSAKDVPTDEHPRLRIGAFLPRADPRDVLVVRAEDPARRLDDLPPGYRVGTDSPRRVGFIRARRPDLLVHPLHGNVDTRLRRLDSGQTDALILAAAGLERLGRGDRIAERLDPAFMPPAPGQGAVALQIRSDDERLIDLTATVDDADTRIAVEAERAFLAASGGGCRSPIGALAQIRDGQLDLLGGYTRPDGSAVAHDRVVGPAQEGLRLGAVLAAMLGPRLPDVAGYGDEPPGVAVPAQPTRPRVIVTRPADQVDELVQCLTAAGIDAVLVPAIAVEPMPAGGDLDAAARDLAWYDWVVVTSVNGARAILAAAERVVAPLGAPRWAAVGPATRQVLDAEGIEVDLQPRRSSAAGIAAELPVKAGSRVLLVRGNLATGRLPKALRARGAQVDDVTAYRTREAPEASRGLLSAVDARGPVAAVLFASGSSARGLAALAMSESIADITSIPAVCIGLETAQEASRLGFSVLARSDVTTAEGLAAATSRALSLQDRGSHDH
jgi:hydroxymethylbilane synthase